MNTNPSFNKPLSLHSTACTLRAYAAALLAAPVLVACGGGGGGGDTASPTPAPQPTVTTTSVGTPTFGQPLLLTVNGTNLDQPVTVTSAGCTSIARSTAAPNVSTATTAFYTCTVAGYGAQQFSLNRGSDNASLGTASYVVPAQVTAATAGAPVYGQSLLLTLNGAGLDMPLTVASPGCTGITRSTTAPNVSSANTAYYTCTVASYGAQQFTVTQTGVAAPLRTAAYTVPAPQVSTSSVGAATLGQSVLLTLNGSGLDLPMSVSSAGCTGIARSTTAPNISSATTAFYTCTASVAGAQQFAVTRAGDNLSLGTASYTVVQPVPVVTSATAGTARYSQQLLLTLNGSNLDQPITVTSSGCSGINRSTTAPNVSTATTAYYTCTANTVGAQQFAVVRTADGGSLATATYTVPVPQVTMNISNGAAVTGTLVITLAPQQAPITVNNFLNYVNAGFYNGTVFHRYASNFVLQGGGYAANLNPASAVPALKPTNPAITLEDNVGLSNTQWTVAMARTPIADSATSQFFINLRDNLFLNRAGTTRGYAVFGTVTTGTAFVTTMMGAPCSLYPALFGSTSTDCLPNPNLVISSATQTQ